MTPVSPLTLVLLLTIVVGVTAAILAWKERPEPGAGPLTLLLAGQIWWSAFLVFDLNAATLASKVFFSNVRWIGVVVIPVAWVLFAAAYTGRDRYLRPRYVASLSVVPAITVALALTNGSHGLLYADATLVEQGGRVVLDRSPGPWFWVIAAYTYLLGALGALPLLSLVTSEAVTFRGQSAALLVGIFTPWGINALFLAGAIPIPGIDPTPIGFAISGVAYLGAIRRFRLFGTSPAPNRSARRLVFERMHAGAVVVDRNDYVVDANENAAEILSIDHRELLGSPAAEVIPDYDELPMDGRAPEYVTVQREDGAHFYDVMVTAIRNFHGRTVGRAITFHDVGEHLRQQQRLEVLNRVLRHNIRTETNLISGYADVLESDGDDDATAQIKAHAERIDELGEKARKIADLFERHGDPADAVPLDDLLTDAVESAAEEHPGIEFDYRPVSEDVHVARVFGHVFANVVENAAEHNTEPSPFVRIEVETDADVVRVRVTDNGPGIHEYERAVLERGKETPLEHGSGLGLWSIKWGASIGGGQVDFEENEPTGSIITVEAPILSPDGVSDREPNPATP